METKEKRRLSFSCVELIIIRLVSQQAIILLIHSELKYLALRDSNTSLNIATTFFFSPAIAEGMKIPFLGLNQLYILPFHSASISSPSINVACQIWAYVLLTFSVCAPQYLPSLQLFTAQYSLSNIYDRSFQKPIQKLTTTFRTSIRPW